MNERRTNWPLWTGLAVTVLGIAAYPLFFYRYPVTRDVPWATYLLLFLGLGLIVAGVRRAPGRRIGALIVAVIGFALAVLFTVGITLGTRVPTGANVPAVGAQAPGFTLPDANRKPVALSQLLGAPGSKGVLLVFYRGYW
jgi:hypothetical protein